VIVGVLVAERDPEHALHHQHLDRVRHACCIPAVPKARRKPPQPEPVRSATSRSTTIPPSDDVRPASNRVNT
jgi:hypothetical protein